ncbi:beta-N-acetylhexosaminidase [Lederbergia wuyishanensis]|uniref:beta-N-acetylhexosaminidase n=1 Tax=Lederbergia wuyishanensis TaxID=1347903 RepID=A0ABU0D057_9BACI|nr:beta-N-acetylhexosaminidase [Lederbergia wuyishanensis]MCJ8006412.1 beta-N-acetylhexosaminidase [Lederbergia wuyishanensis]MDQ0341785.1 beta-N-acetylhexosaminidase [Lederbergia wuyishanensis]
MKRQQRKSRNKLLIFTIPLLILSLIFGVYYYAIKESSSGQTTQDKEGPTITQPTETQTADKSTVDSKNDQNSNLEKLVEETFSLSKDGKVPNIPFVSGKTEWKEVNKEWGKSDHISETAKGRYEEYESHHTTIGYANQIVNDIRSYDTGLQNISLNEIKKTGGEPDAIRYYKDSTVDQMILVYHTTSSTDLLWVLPVKTGQEPNPKVHHISLFTQVKKTPNQQAQVESPNKQEDVGKQSNQQGNQSISEVISKMSVEDKIGQMILAGVSGTTMDANAKQLIGKFHVGGIIFYKYNFDTPAQTVQLVNQLKSGNSSSLPLLLGVDQEGGRVTRLPGGLVNFPPNKRIGQVNNPDFSYKVGTLLGNELKEFGLNLDFAPVLDINSNPNNPVIGDRSYGNNAEIVSKLGIQTMRGIHSQNVITTIKHFPGHGDTSVDSHLDLPIVNKSLRELKELELIPFERAINQGADVVMVAHILLPQLDKTNPGTMSKAVQTDLLRKQLGFTGVIITDDMTMGAITEHFDIGKAAVESVKAGSDIILVGHDYNNVVKIISSLKTAVQNGEISEQRLNESIGRIIKLKRKYSINDEKVRNPNINEINNSINSLLNNYLQ